MKKARLLKIAEHLERGKLLHKKFDFNSVNYTPRTEKLDERGCGTNGCAMGEFPAIFRGWEFDSDGHLLCPASVGNSFDRYTSDRVLSRFLGVEEGELYYLFYPTDDKEELKEGRLPPKATRKRVAKHIRKFVAAGGIY